MSQWKSRKSGKRKGQHFKSDGGHSHVRPYVAGVQTVGVPKRTVQHIRSREMSFATYEEALAYSDECASHYPSKNEYYASDEYRHLYPVLIKLRGKGLKPMQHSAQVAMKEVGVKEGDKVEYSTANPFGQIFDYEGIVKLNRDGIPYVYLTTPVADKKIIRWHKGFKKVGQKKK